jgi:hypothetical protein
MPGLSASREPEASHQAKGTRELQREICEFFVDIPPCGDGRMRGNLLAALRDSAGFILRPVRVLAPQKLLWVRRTISQQIEQPKATVP